MSPGRELLDSPTLDVRAEGIAFTVGMGKVADALEALLAVYYTLDIEYSRLAKHTLLLLQHEILSIRAARLPTPVLRLLNV